MRLPIRLKIVLMTSVALTVSLGSVLFVGAGHFVEDKNSYILDFNFNRVRSAASHIEHQIDSVLLTLRLMHQAPRGGDHAAVLEKIFRESAERFSVRGTLVLEETADGLTPIATFGMDRHVMVRALDLLGWGSRRLESVRYLVGKGPSGEMVLGTRIQDSGNPARVYIAFARPNFNLTQKARRFDIYLVDATGNILLSEFSGKTSNLSAAEFKRHMRTVLDGSFESGAQVWDAAEPVIAGYQKLGSRELTVTGLLPATEAYDAVNGLVWRTLTLGLSILGIAIGLTLLFVRQLTEGLRQMAKATQQVSQGVFSFRVGTDKLGNDELGALASSFNTMADKIDELMQQTAAKVETEKNLETVRSVQSLLVPDKPFQHENFNLAGISLSAGECGGDWWNYSQVRDHIIVVIGKVSGRGLPAAMLTAATHGAFSTFVAAARLMTRVTPSMKLLISNLNSAVFDASRGKGQLRCFVMILNLHSGVLQTTNCGFNSPWLHRVPPKPKEPPKEISKRFMRIGMKESAPLGVAGEPVYQTEAYQMLPEDVLFWHTTGFFDIRNLKGERMLSQQMVYNDISSMIEKYGPQSDRIVNGLIEVAKKTWGAAAEALPDDATTMIASIPKKAYFVHQEPTKPAAAAPGAAGAAKPGAAGAAAPKKAA